MKALSRMALIVVPLFIAPTGRFAAGVARVLSAREFLKFHNPRMILAAANAAQSRPVHA
jgi:hypothetical protein